MSVGSFSVRSRLSDGENRVVLSICGDDGKEASLTLSIEGTERLEKEARKARRRAMFPFRRAARVVGYLFLLPALYFGIGLELTWLAGLVGWHPMEYNREVFIVKDYVRGCLEKARKEGDNLNLSVVTACLDRWNR